LPNLVKYCVDCFSLLFSILVVLVTSPAASISAWLADFSERLSCAHHKEGWRPRSRTNDWFERGDSWRRPKRRAHTNNKECKT